MAATKRRKTNPAHATVRKRLHDRAQVFANEFHNCIVGIADLDAQSRVEYIGTATLFQVGHRYFAASAKHVFEHLSTRSLALVQEGLVEITGRYFYSSDPTRKDDPFDLAFVEVTPQQVEQLPGSRFLRINDCDLTHEPLLTQPAGSKYYAFGYPCKLQKKLPVGEAVIPEPLIVQVLPAPGQKYNKLPIYPEHHLLFDFDPKAASGDTGARMPPKLNGMSGCGVWTAPRLPTDPPGGQKLVALLIEYHGGSLKTIVATRAKILLAGIVKFFPDVIAP